METKFNFNSQVCTSKVQSERLLALGLKPETADMRWERISEKYAYYPSTKTPYASSDIPAWSLHRLIEMYLNSSYYLIESIEFETDDEEDAYTKTIRQIEWLIKEGYFNKEYLV